MTEANVVSTEATTNAAEQPVASVLTGAQPATNVNTAKTTEQESVSHEPNLEFINSLPQEFRSKAVQKGFKGIDDVLKSYNNLESLMGKRFEDLTAEEVTKLNHKLGAPETPEGYNFALPEGITDDGTVSQFKLKAHELGISKDKAEALFNWYTGSQMEAMNLSASQLNLQAKEHVETLKSEFGSAFATRIEMANSALKTFGGDEVVNVLKKYNLQNEPALVKMFAELGKFVQEDQIVGKKESSAFGITPSEASDKIRKLFADSEFMRRYRSPTDPKHGEAVKQLDELYRLKSAR